MTTTTYTATLFGDAYTMTADFAQASCPVEYDGNASQYQVADFGHDAAEAMRRHLEACVEAGGDDADDYADEIDAAVESMTTREVYAE